MPQLDIQDRERDKPHRVGPENPWPRPISCAVDAKSQVWNRQYFSHKNANESHQGRLNNPYGCSVEICYPGFVYFQVSSL